MNETLLVECAEWLYKNKDTPDWWTPYVLTEHNPDKSNPHICIEDAYELFRELVRRRLAVHIIVSRNDVSFPAFEFRKGKDTEWEELMRKSNWIDLKLIPWAKAVLNNSWKFAIFIIGTFLAALITQKTVDWLSIQQQEKEQILRISEPQFQELMLELQKEKAPQEVQAASEE